VNNDKTLGVRNTTWATIELASAGLLATITARTTYKEVKKAGGLGNYLSPKGDAWRSATTYSNFLIAMLLLKGAVDAAKSYGVISGVRATPAPQVMGLQGYGRMNYF
jgi:hypothetical protein